MNTIILVIVVCAVITSFIIWKKRQKKWSFLDQINNVDVAVIEGTLDFSVHVVDYLKSRKLEKGKDTPFIATPTLFKDEKVIPGGVSSKSYVLYIGVYKEDNNMVLLRRVDSDEWDRQTRDVLGEEMLVVLS